MIILKSNVLVLKDEKQQLHVLTDDTINKHIYLRWYRADTCPSFRGKASGTAYLREDFVADFTS